MFRSWLKSLISIAIIMATISTSSIVMGDQDVEEPERIPLDDALLEAMEIFEGMSPEEMEETIMQLIQMVGDDDPETKAELEVLLNELMPQVKAAQMAKDDELAVATHNALKMLGGSTWDEIWAKQEDILEGVLANGQLTPEHAAHLKSDEKAWKEELKFIWDQLQKQVKEAEL